MIEFVIIMCISIGTVYASKATGGFGAQTRIPSASEISSVSISFTDELYFRSSSRTKIFTSDEAKKIIIDFHDNIVSEYQKENIKTYDDYSNYMQKYFDDREKVEYMGLSYKLKSGFKLNRDYRLNEEHLEQIYELLLTDEYKRQVSDKLGRASEFRYLKRETSELVYHMDVTNEKKKTNKIKFDTEEEAEKIYSELAEAYYNDISKITSIEQLRESDIGLYINFIIVREDFTETLAVIEKYKLNAPAYDDILETY